MSQEIKINIDIILHVDIISELIFNQFILTKGVGYAQRGRWYMRRQKGICHLSKTSERYSRKCLGGLSLPTVIESNYEVNHLWLCFHPS